MSAAPATAGRSALTYNLRGFIPQFTDVGTHHPRFDVLTATADSLQRDLIARRLESVHLVEEYQRSICKHNGYLNAVYELAPGAMDRAKEMDRLRTQGTILSPLHGIPILIKDNMNTDPSMKMGTRGGAVALIGAEPARSARIVDQLLDAGMIILGKSTMSELAFWKGSGIPCGWSAAHGQAQSAYIFGGLEKGESVCGHSNPDGSSTGSAIATSAGLVTLALGTETSGSLVNPATRASLYTIKATRDIVSGEGILPLCGRFDTPGPLAKCVRDLANIFTLLVDPTKAKLPDEGYASVLHGDWSDIKVGTLDPALWKLSADAVKPVEEATKQLLETTYEVFEKIKSLARSYHANISPTLDDKFTLNGENALLASFSSGMGNDMDAYLKDLKSIRVRSLRELVDWNIQHADEALPAEYPNQDLLVAAAEADRSTDRLSKLENHAQAVGDEFESLFSKLDIDVIIAPADSSLHLYSAACGFPIATLPISYLDYNGRPFGLTIACPRHGEAMLFKVMHAWESTFPAREAPRAFLEVAANSARDQHL